MNSGTVAPNFRDGLELGGRIRSRDVGSRGTGKQRVGIPDLSFKVQDLRPGRSAAECHCAHALGVEHAQRFAGIAGPGDGRPVNLNAEALRHVFLTELFNIGRALSDQLLRDQRNRV